MLSVGVWLSTTGRDPSGPDQIAELVVASRAAMVRG